jgi:hypothetical protein
MAENWMPLNLRGEAGADADVGAGRVDDAVAIAAEGPGRK